MCGKFSSFQTHIFRIKDCINILKYSKTTNESLMPGPRLVVKHIIAPKLMWSFIMQRSKQETLKASSQTLTVRIVQFDCSWHGNMYSSPGVFFNKPESLFSLTKLKDFGKIPGYSYILLGNQNDIFNEIKNFVY